MTKSLSKISLKSVDFIINPKTYLFKKEYSINTYSMIFAFLLTFSNRNFSSVQILSNQPGNHLCINDKACKNSPLDFTKIYIDQKVLKV